MVDEDQSDGQGDVENNDIVDTMPAGVILADSGPVGWRCVGVNVGVASIHEVAGAGVCSLDECAARRFAHKLDFAVTGRSGLVGFPSSKWSGNL